MWIMKVLYCWISSVEQKTARQRVNEKDYKVVIEDKCSGAIPFFERPGGMEIKKYVDEGILTALAVWQIDRLGRDLRDIINTIHYFNERKITITFISQGLTTLDSTTCYILHKFICWISVSMATMVDRESRKIAKLTKNMDTITRSPINGHLGPFTGDPFFDR